MVGLEKLTTMATLLFLEFTSFICSTFFKETSLLLKFLTLSVRLRHWQGLRLSRRLLLLLPYLLTKVIFLLDNIESLAIRLEAFSPSVLLLLLPFSEARAADGVCIVV